MTAIEAEPTVPAIRNVRQRKLAVMKRAGGIKPDAKYNGKTREGVPIVFEYVSVQAVSNGLREVAADEGLDIDVYPDPEQPSWIVVELVNADDPADKISHRWPMVPNDKAWAYSFKYPLVRTFLIGDSEEGDEHEMSTRSAQAQTQAASAPKARKAKDEAPPATGDQSKPAETPQLSAAELAKRAPLYDAAKRIGESDGWVDACLEGRLKGREGQKYTAAQVMRSLESRGAGGQANGEPAQAATKPAETAKAADGPPDPERLVCPISGHDAGPGKVARPSNVDPTGKPDGSGQYYRCTLAAGGCGAGFHINHAITRAEYDRRTSAREAAQAAAAAETSPELRAKLNEVAGFDGQMCALCGIKGEHAPDCTSHAARESRGEVPYPEGATAGPTS